MADDKQETELRITVRRLAACSTASLAEELVHLGLSHADAGLAAVRLQCCNVKVDGLDDAEAGSLVKEFGLAGGQSVLAPVDNGRGRTVVLSGTFARFRAFFSRAVSSPALREVAEDIKRMIYRTDEADYILKGRTRSWCVGSRTLVMGILNVTPDSFYDGGRYAETASAVERGIELVEEGADLVDVGGESTRPGAGPVGAAEEAKRVVPVVEALASAGVAVSVDTSKAAVARAALDAGAEIINDVTALGGDPDMAGVVRDSGAAVVLMHMRGTPGTMQRDVEYRDLVGTVYGYLAERLEYAGKSGIEPARTVVDPGIGFGKSAEGNFELLRRLREFTSLGRPVLVGHSRKSFIGAALGSSDPGRRLTGTVAVSAAAVLNGAHILRVHDVSEARSAAAVTEMIRGLRPGEGAAHEPSGRGVEA